jgi:hypothetical protein
MSHQNVGAHSSIPALSAMIDTTSDKEKASNPSFTILFRPFISFSCQFDLFKKCYADEEIAVFLG